MKLLILGGTRFLGRALVNSAKSRGHELTLFNRGMTNPHLFPEVEHLVGDRSVDLSPLRGRRWDAVIDTCGYEPAMVRKSTGLLSAAVDLYIFISTISVYADLSQPGTNESASVAQLPPGASEAFDIEQYGPLKALCEQAAEQVMPGQVLIIRPGLIVGDQDPTDRFTYWPWRIAQGGKVLAPGKPEYLTQFIDVRDLADWIIRVMEAGRTGIYNAAGNYGGNNTGSVGDNGAGNSGGAATHSGSLSAGLSGSNFGGAAAGPYSPLSMGDLLEACRKVSGSNARFTWLSEEFLLTNGVQPWTELPLWLPESDPTTAGMNRVSIRKAEHAGLTFRPLADTLHSTLAWANSRPADYSWKAGLPREREAELLAKALGSRR